MKMKIAESLPLSAFINNAALNTIYGVYPVAFYFFKCSLWTHDGALNKWNMIFPTFILVYQDFEWGYINIEVVIDVMWILAGRRKVSDKYCFSR